MATTKKQPMDAKKRPVSPDLDRRNAEQAYSRALSEAGVTKDDLQLLRELAQHAQTLTVRTSAQVTRIYL